MSSPDNPFAPPPNQGPGYGPPPYGQPAYGPPPGYPPAQGYGPPPLPGQVPPPYPGWQPAPQTDGTAIAALVLAVSSFIVFPVIPAIIALVLARSADDDIAASGGRLTGEGLLTATRWVAWSNIALCVGGLLLVLLFLGVFFAV